MKLADKIAIYLQRYVISSPGDIAIPRFYLGHHECDVFLLRKSGLCIEYEIKISRSDFKADMLKHISSWPIKGKIFKHDKLALGEGIPNRFYFVVPDNLVRLDEIPKHCGLIYYDENYWGKFKVIKSAPLLHRLKLMQNVQELTHICTLLAGRCRAFNFRFDNAFENLKRKNLSE